MKTKDLKRLATEYFEDELSGEPLHQDIVIDTMVNFVNVIKAYESLHIPKIDIEYDLIYSDKRNGDETICNDLDVPYFKSKEEAIRFVKSREDLADQCFTIIEYIFT